MRWVENNWRLNLFRQRDKYYRMDLGIYLLASRVKKKKKRNSKNSAKDTRIESLQFLRHPFTIHRAQNLSLAKYIAAKKKKRKRGERWNKRNDLLGLKGNRRRNPKIEERTRHCDGNIGAEPSPVSRHVFPEEAARISIAI